MREEHIHNNGFIFSVSGYEPHIEVEILRNEKYSQVENYYSGSHHIFKNEHSAYEYINRVSHILTVIYIMKDFTTDLSTYGYHGENLGMSVDSYERAAEIIYNMFDKTGTKDS